MTNGYDTMTRVRRVGFSTPLIDAPVYAVYARPKDEPDADLTRNESPDNPERYEVWEVHA